jgi:hypothetical protein
MTTSNAINFDAPDDLPLQEWVEREWIGIADCHLKAIRLFFKPIRTYLEFF